MTFDGCRYKSIHIEMYITTGNIATFVNCRFPKNGDIYIDNADAVFIGDMNGATVKIKTGTPTITATDAVNGMFHMFKHKRSYQRKIVMPEIDRFIFESMGTRYPVNQVDQQFKIPFKGVRNEYYFVGDSEESSIDIRTISFGLIADIESPIDISDFDNLDIADVWNSFRGRATSPLSNNIPVNPPKDIPDLIRWITAFGKFCRIFKYNENGG